jgi:hypothetical protein
MQSKWIYWTLAFGLVTMCVPFPLFVVARVSKLTILMWDFFVSCRWPNYQRSLQRARVAGIYERIESAKAKGSKKAEGKKKR